MGGACVGKTRPMLDKRVLGPVLGDRSIEDTCLLCDVPVNMLMCSHLAKHSET